MKNQMHEIFGTMYIAWTPENPDGMHRCYFPLSVKKAMEIANIEFTSEFDGWMENEIGRYPTYTQFTRATPGEIIDILKAGAFRNYVDEWHPVSDAQWEEAKEDIKVSE